jgi:hypothetical protein
MILSSTLNTPTSSNGKDAHRSAFDKKTPGVASISSNFRTKALELLVALSGLLTSADYRRLMALLWSKYLDSTDPQVFAPVRNANVCIIRS